jgi:hypothetical protein
MRLSRLASEGRVWQGATYKRGAGPETRIVALGPSEDRC